MTDAQLNSGLSCAQDMIYSLRVLESLELQVKPPILLEIDNCGTFDLANNWNISGRTRHIETLHNYLRGLKEEGYLVVK